jgi:hypothetical protein
MLAKVSLVREAKGKGQKNKEMASASRSKESTEQLMYLIFNMGFSS